MTAPFLALEAADYVVILGAFTSSILAVIAAIVGGIITVKGLQQVRTGQAALITSTAAVVTTADKIATKTDEIHTLTNSNYTDQKDAITKLQETVATLELPDLDKDFGETALLDLSNREEEIYGYDAWNGYNSVMDLFLSHYCNTWRKRPRAPAR